MFVRTRAAVGKNCSKGELYKEHILGPPTTCPMKETVLTAESLGATDRDTLLR